MSAATGLAELAASGGDKYYYDAAAGRLHLKLVVMADRDWATLFVRP